MACQRGGILAQLVVGVRGEGVGEVSTCRIEGGWEVGEEEEEEGGQS